MCNIGIACLEELADIDDVIGSDKPKKTTQKRAVSNTNKKATQVKTDAKKKPPAKDKPEPKAKAKQPKQSANSETEGQPDNQNKSGQPKMSEAQKRAIYNLSRRRGISVEELETMALDTYQCELENLNSKDASTFIRNLQQAA
jgi:hypothetical protein